MSVPAAALLLTSHALPTKPTRDQLCAVKVSFQGLIVETEEFGLLPWFEPFLCSLNAADRQAVYAAKRAAGDTHCFLSLSYAYQESGQPYNDIPGRDFTQDVATWCAYIREAVQNGFLVVASLAADGQVYQPEGQTYGWQWGMDNMTRVLAVMEDQGVLDYCAIMGGYELLGPGGNWDDWQLNDFYVKLRGLVGDSGVLAMELGSGYSKWLSGTPEPPGQASWDSAGGQAIDIFLQEQPQPINEGDHWDGCQQMASSTLGPAATNIAAPNRLTWYLQSGTPRGMRTVICFEWALYDFIRGRLTVAQVSAMRAQLFTLGYSYVS